MVNPMHVKRSKELDDNLQTKHDAKDALVIARLVKDGRFSYPRILAGVDATLRNQLVEERCAVRNKLIRWLDRYFPEFTQVFSDFGKTAMAALECSPFPGDVIAKTTEKLLHHYRQVEGIKAPQKSKIMKLAQVAYNSIGVTEGQEMARIEIATLVRRYRQLEHEIQELTNKLTDLAKTSVEYEWLSTVPGLGDRTIVELLSEIGSFSYYQHPRQLIKLAGLTLREHSSGQHRGQKRISKRGRRRLRALFFRVMMPMVRCNEAFVSYMFTTRQELRIRYEKSNPW